MSFDTRWLVVVTKNNTPTIRWWTGERCLLTQGWWQLCLGIIQDAYTLFWELTQLLPPTPSSECQSEAMCVAWLCWKNAQLCLALILSHLTITTLIEPHAFRPSIANERTCFHSVRIPLCTLRTHEYVPASLDGELAPYGVPTSQSACDMYLNGYPAPSLPCGSPAPAWSPNLRPACTCSSWVSSPGSSPPCPDLSTEARRL